MNKLYSIIAILALGSASLTHAKPVSTQPLPDLVKKIHHLIDVTLANLAVKVDRDEFIKSLELLKKEPQSLEDAERTLDVLITIVDKELHERNLRSDISLIRAENGSEHFFDCVMESRDSRRTSGRWKLKNGLSVYTQQIPSYYGTSYTYKTINISLSELKARGFDLTIDQKIGFLAYNLQQLQDNQKAGKHILKSAVPTPFKKAAIKSLKKYTPAFLYAGGIAATIGIIIKLKQEFKETSF